MSVRIYLVRHGETDWSVSGRHTGLTDLPLTAQGEAQARDLAPCLQRISFATVLTSPLQRARQTAALAGLADAATRDADLVEWNYGAYEGRQTSDIQRERPGWRVYRDGCPGGESPSQVGDRADRVIAHLRSLSGAVAVFSHGHFIGALATRWIGLPLVQAIHFSLSTASLGILGDHPDYPGTPVIALWNVVPADIAPPPRG